MRTDFIPALALAAKANAFLRGDATKPEVLAGHPAFERFHDLEFIRQTGLGGATVATSSAPWFRKLQSEDVDRVRPILGGMKLDRTPDDPWGLLTEGDKGLELWTPNSGRRFEGHSDLQPLHLTITSSRFDRWFLKDLTSRDRAAEALLTALQTTRDALVEGGQAVVANIVGTYLSLHHMESPEVVGELMSLVPDLHPCSVPLFASASRCLALLRKTGWLSSADAMARFGEPLWVATRTALEATV